jgi:hypothetical protein
MNAESALKPRVSRLHRGYGGQGADVTDEFNSGRRSDNRTMVRKLCN